MELNYSKRLTLLHALCTAETLRDDESAPNLADFNALDAADYLSCYVTFKAIQNAQRSPLAERSDNFDMLSVYQAFAMLVFAFLTAPLTSEKITPDFQAAQITLAKTLFAGLQGFGLRRRKHSLIETKDDPAPSPHRTCAARPFQTL